MSAGGQVSLCATLRPATRDDAAALSALITETLRTGNAADYSSAVIARVAEAFSPACVALMIEQRRVMVACAGARIVGTAALDGDEIRSVFVAPDRQGRGIGRALMVAIARMATDAGVLGLTLHASLTARGFYAGLGFAALGEAVDGEEITVVMRREILPGAAV